MADDHPASKQRRPPIVFSAHLSSIFTSGKLFLQRLSIIQIVGQGKGQHLKDHDVLHIVVVDQGVDKVLWLTATGTD